MRTAGEPETFPSVVSYSVGVPKTYPGSSAMPSKARGVAKKSQNARSLTTLLAWYFSGGAASSLCARGTTASFHSSSVCTPVLSRVTAAAELLSASS